MFKVRVIREGAGKGAEIGSIHEVISVQTEEFWLGCDEVEPVEDEPNAYIVTYGGDFFWVEGSKEEALQTICTLLSKSYSPAEIRIFVVREKKQVIVDF